MPRAPTFGPMPNTLLVFDLDGTLLESLPDLHEAVNLALADHGLPRRTEDEVRRAIGEGARVLIARSVPQGTSDESVDAVWASFRTHYNRVCTHRSHLLPGVTAFLDARASDPVAPRMAILTNKPQEPTDLLVRHFGLDRWIHRTLGGDTPLGRKPDPSGLRDIMQGFDATPETTLFVGDGPADLAVAAAAGVRAILLDTGYGRREELDDLPRWKEVADFHALSRIWSTLGVGAS